MHFQKHKRCVDDLTEIGVRQQLSAISDCKWLANLLAKAHIRYDSRWYCNQVHGWRIGAQDAATRIGERSSRNRHQEQLGLMYLCRLQQQLCVRWQIWLQVLGQLDPISLTARFIAASRLIKVVRSMLYCCGPWARPQMQPRLSQRKLDLSCLTDLSIKSLDTCCLVELPP